MLVAHSMAINCVSGPSHSLSLAIESFFDRHREPFAPRESFSIAPNKLTNASDSHPIGPEKHSNATLSHATSVDKLSAADEKASEGT